MEEYNTILVLSVMFSIIGAFVGFTILYFVVKAAIKNALGELGITKGEIDDLKGYYKWKF